MNKPKIFISSTVYDFKDLRSALKYWLEEAGYNVQMSEYCDFEKDSSQNSYEACLDVIEQCDYFILLVGSRIGGMYDGTISITRKEYQKAYELAQRGKIKKIITFIRQNVWEVLEDRESLEAHIRKYLITENGNPVSTDSIKYFYSKIIKDAKHIKEFVDEIARKKDFKDKKQPTYNWINIFNSFSDIIDVLKTELHMNIDIERQIAEYNIKLALSHNISRIELSVAKGKKENIAAHAKNKGESINSFVNRAIDETMDRDNKKDGDE